MALAARRAVPRAACTSLALIMAQSNLLGGTQDVEAYLTGQINTSEFIQQSAPELNFAELLSLQVGARLAVLQVLKQCHGLTAMR